MMLENKILSTEYDLYLAYVTCERKSIKSTLISKWEKYQQINKVELI